MIILDTNIVSEPHRPRPDLSVLRWLDSHRPSELFLCAPVLAELRYGVERLPTGNRRKQLEEWAFRIEHELFADRILPFDPKAAHEFGRLFHRRVTIGRPIGVVDAMIAAVVSANGAVLATRDIDDFADLGLDIINPFGPSAPSA